MVATKNKHAFILGALLFFAPLISFADTQQSEVISFAKTKVSFAVKALGERIEHCEKQRNIAPVPVLDAKIIKSMRAKRNELLVGLTYLNFNNSHQCEKNLRINLAYTLGVLAVVLNHYQLDIQSVKEIEAGLVYPSVDELKLAVDYNKLPDAIRTYLEKTVGDKPFSLLETIKVNYLSKS